MIGHVITNLVKTVLVDRGIHRILRRGRNNWSYLMFTKLEGNLLSCKGVRWPLARPLIKDQINSSSEHMNYEV